MKKIGFSFFILTAWIVILTFSYCQLRENYDISNAEVERLHETVKVYKQDMEKFVETYSDRTSKELEEQFYMDDDVDMFTGTDDKQSDDVSFCIFN